MLTSPSTSPWHRLRRMLTSASPQNPQHWSWQQAVYLYPVNDDIVKQVIRTKTCLFYEQDSSRFIVMCLEAAMRDFQIYLDGRVWGDYPTHVVTEQAICWFIVRTISAYYYASPYSKYILATCISIMCISAWKNLVGDIHCNACGQSRDTLNFCANMLNIFLRNSKNLQEVVSLRLCCVSHNFF